VRRALTSSCRKRRFPARAVNGSFLPIQGCEGYAALFAGVASPRQAEAAAAALSDPRRFLLNFSLPTVSLANPGYVEHGYWKVPTTTSRDL
jgi:hypothetical protein